LELESSAVYFSWSIVVLSFNVRLDVCRGLVSVNQAAAWKM